MTDFSIAEAISKTYLNRDVITASQTCGCYRCRRLFSPSDIVLWADSNDPNDDDPGALRGQQDQY